MLGVLERSSDVSSLSAQLKTPRSVRLLMFTDVRLFKLHSSSSSWASIETSSAARLFWKTLRDLQVGEILDAFERFDRLLHQLQARHRLGFLK